MTFEERCALVVRRFPVHSKVYVRTNIGKHWGLCTVLSHDQLDVELQRTEASGLEHIPVWVNERDLMPPAEASLLDSVGGQL